MGGFSGSGGLQMGSTGGNGGLSMGGFTDLGLQMGRTLNNLEMGGFTDLGLQMGHTQNLFDWKKAAGYAEKGITVGAKTWCQVHGC